MPIFEFLSDYQDAAEMLAEEKKEAEKQAKLNKARTNRKRK